ncbi:MAG: hypothetical protein ACYTA3_00395 [Planctomycetota bacterium]
MLSVKGTDSAETDDSEFQGVIHWLLRSLDSTGILDHAAGRERSPMEVLEPPQSLVESAPE